jgi:hypothetical protein
MTGEEISYRDNLVTLIEAQTNIHHVMGLARPPGGQSWQHANFM